MPPCPTARKDPTLIRFSKVGLDLVRGHATLDMAPVDLTTVSVGVLLTNSQTVLYRDVLPAGSLVPNSKGTAFSYRNLDARSTGGLYDLKLKQRGKSGSYTINFTSYADMSAATDANMRLQYYIGEDLLPFITINSPWTQTSSGWRAPKDH